MKILWLTLDALLPMDSAGRMGVLKRLESVSKKNDIYLYYFYDKENDNQESVYYLSKICKKVKGFKRNKNYFYLFFYLLLYPYTVSTRISKCLIEDLSECIKQNNIELINIDFPQMGYSLLKLADISNVRVVMNQHNIEWLRFIEMSKSKDVSYIKKILMKLEGYRLKKFENFLYKRINFYAQTFVTDNDLKIFSKIHNVTNSILEVFPGGGVLKEIENSSMFKGTDKAIVFVGVMSNEFNPEGAFWFINNVFPLIKKGVSKVKFYVVGKEPISKLRNITDPNIIVTGFVNNLDYYYQKADVIVIPVQHGGGVKLKLLEAMGHNKIVVSTSQGARGTDFINRKSILIADDAKTFAELCIDVLNNPENYSDLKKNAKELFMRKYSWDVIGKKYNDFLENLKK